MFANPHKQQILPLRCASVGTTSYDNNLSSEMGHCHTPSLAGGDDVRAVWRRKVITVTMSRKGSASQRERLAKRGADQVPRMAPKRKQRQMRPRSRAWERPFSRASVLEFRMRAS